ncbi:PREDICTED: tRNA pseudouridine synthase A, mitochondrial, partial [Ceratosolen solmsi marchali]|uniref:Pseudouridylate synthase 1 homolog n=1 Tax=Ceratosolen solmsi marchali TaxID=326594 RepID=A0AAJ6YFT8_9HYME
MDMTQNTNININKIEKRLLNDDITNNSKKQKVDQYIRIKRKNYAMLLSYLGKNYYGMQRNPGMATVEEHLIKALLKANLINSETFGMIQTINFQRAARTDKGVSAIRQVVSLKLPEDPCKDTINNYLPEDIRVFGIKRVTKGFNSKSQCDARTYSYTIPTYAFIPENLEQFQTTANSILIEKRLIELSIINGKPYHEYRISKEKLQRLQELLKYFEGTHKFHNYTSKVLPLDPRARRYIMNFIAEEPFTINNMEFITLKIKGQSFMLHQIRKMIAIIIGIMRNIITAKELEQTFEQQKFDIYRAPSLGLMLYFVHYEYYDKRYGSDGIHEKLDWADCEKEIIEFEKNIIYNYIIDTEIKENTMLNWLAKLNTNSFILRTNEEQNLNE